MLIERSDHQCQSSVMNENAEKTGEFLIETGLLLKSDHFHNWLFEEPASQFSWVTPLFYAQLRQELANTAMQTIGLTSWKSFGFWNVMGEILIETGEHIGGSLKCVNNYSKAEFQDAIFVTLLKDFDHHSSIEVYLQEDLENRSIARFVTHLFRYVEARHTAIAGSPNTVFNEILQSVSEVYLLSGSPLEMIGDLAAQIRERRLPERFFMKKDRCSILVDHRALKGYMNPVDYIPVRLATAKSASF